MLTPLELREKQIPIKFELRIVSEMGPRTQSVQLSKRPKYSKDLECYGIDTHVFLYSLPLTICAINLFVTGVDTSVDLYF